MTVCECAKEETSQSEFSPGVVGCEESIVFALVNPLTSSVKQLSKSQLKDAKLSVCRADYITGPDAKSKTVDELIAKDSSRTHEGFFWALCQEIRELKLGETSARAFCVIDDALQGYAAHAHLGYAEPGDPNLKNHRESARGNLLIAFQKRGISKDWSKEPFADATWPQKMSADASN